MRNRNSRTSLRRRNRLADPMQEFDGLPAELRNWLTTATLPWAPKSALKAYRKAVSKTGSGKEAVDELNRIQSRLLKKDCRKVWGEHHPNSHLQSW